MRISDWSSDVCSSDLEVIPGLDETFDMVFIDADKKGYADYFDLVIGKVRSGGIIIADNVLREGKVVTAETDKETRNMQDFNEKIMTDKRVENLWLPLSDGFTMGRESCRDIVCK